MVKYFDNIPDFLIPWIEDQKVFWVATAPLTGDGLVNVSPKGVKGSFRVVDSNKVWYEDLTGSGIETVAHVRENRRITILFNAFEGPPRICRIYGKGTVYEYGTPEYEALLPPEKRQVGSRSVITVDVFKASTSCGFGVPFFTYKSERHRILNNQRAKEIHDIEAEKEKALVATADNKAVQNGSSPHPHRGLKYYWSNNNMKSLDGIPGLLSAHSSTKGFPTPRSSPWPKDDERVSSSGGRNGGMRQLLGVVGSGLGFGMEEMKLLVAFLTGVMLTVAYFTRPHV